MSDIGLLFKVRVYFPDQHHGSSWFLSKVCKPYLGKLSLCALTLKNLRGDTGLGLSVIPSSLNTFGSIVPTRNLKLCLSYGKFCK